MLVGSNHCIMGKGAMPAVWISVDEFELVARGMATLAPSALKCFDAIDSVMSASPGVKSKSKVALALGAEALMCVEKMAEAGLEVEMIKASIDAKLGGRCGPRLLAGCLWCYPMAACYLARERPSRRPKSEGQPSLLQDCDIRRLEALAKTKSRSGALAGVVDAMPNAEEACPASILEKNQAWSCESAE